MGLIEEGLIILQRVYEIGEEVGARLLEPGKTVATPKEGYVAVYEWQVRNGLTFLIGELLREIIKEYQLSVSQIYPLGICKIIVFEMCYEKAGVTGSVKLFRYFYYIKNSAGGYYFSSRSKKKDFLSKYSECPPGRMETECVYGEEELVSGGNELKTECGER